MKVHSEVHNLETGGCGSRSDVGSQEAVGICLRKQGVEEFDLG